MTKFTNVIRIGLTSLRFAPSANSTARGAPLDLTETCGRTKTSGALEAEGEGPQAKSAQAGETGQGPATRRRRNASSIAIPFLSGNSVD